MILRNGGNDFYFTKFRDAVLQKAMGHLNVDIQHYQPLVYYLNGEFWGVMAFRERLDDDYFEIKYGLDKDSIDVIENLDEVEYGSADDYNEHYDFMKDQDLNSPGNYEYVQTIEDLTGFEMASEDPRSFIHSSAKLTAPNTDSYRATRAVYLKPGFIAITKTVFSAKIIDCGQ